MRRDQLVARRLELGVTQEQLAYALGRDPTTVRRWEAGITTPQPLQRRPLAEALEVTMAELNDMLSDPDTPHAPKMIDRRTVLAGSLASIATASLGPPRWVDPEVVDYLRRQLAGHWRTDRELGPHVLLPGAVGQCVALLHMVDLTRGRLHTEVLHLTTAFTGFVAWLYQDAGDLVACGSWLDRTLELGHRAGDPQLLAYALTCKAMVRADDGDGLGAVELADAARDRAGAKARVMAMQQAALGHALTGDRAAVDSLLDDIGQQLEDVHRDARVWGGDRLYDDPAHVVGVHQATCYGHLGLADEAADLWGHLSPEATPGRRDRGVYLARQAAALLDAGAPDAAAQRAAVGAPLVAATGSARMRCEYDRVRELAARWAGSRPGRDLAHALDTIPN
jgi:transcriptional regulator with XRE-family HTH domain